MTSDTSIPVPVPDDPDAAPSTTPQPLPHEPSTPAEPPTPDTQPAPV
jgi:hypothetical protein